jgi:hypothetical protein
MNIRHRDAIIKLFLSQICKMSQSIPLTPRLPSADPLREPYLSIEDKNIIINTTRQFPKNLPQSTPPHLRSKGTLCSQTWRLKHGREGSPKVQLRLIRTPSRISDVAALTTCSVKKLSVPSSSCGPQRPQAESQGSPLRSGRSEKDGREGIGVVRCEVRVDRRTDIYSRGRRPGWGRSAF